MPLSGPLRGRYQVLILGHDSDTWVLDCSHRLEMALALAVSSLGVNFKTFLSMLPSGSTKCSYEPKLPCVAVFFGNSENPILNAVDVDRLTQLLRDGALIIPVVSDISAFGKLVPTEIAHLNGISVFDAGSGFERLAARILEGFGLLRETRRLFISYRRIETSTIAGQLYEALDASGFDVFLDTHGALKPGEPFQEVLWHRLADTDVAVLLDSPNFLASRWTEEELARANNSNIQILQLLWPGQEEYSAAAFSTFHPLEMSDFVDDNTIGHAARLRDEAISQVVDTVEGLRARAIGARHAFLIREFVQEARKVGLAVHTTLDRALVISGHRADSIFVRPAVGVPDAVGYETLEGLHARELCSGRKYAFPPILLYDQTGIQSKWIGHLKWLNGSLSRVKSLSLTDAKVWLAEVAYGGSTE